MEQNTVGNVLHYYRKKYNLSAQNICGGICSVPKLYNLEDGYREIDSMMCETLLSRIGKEVNQFEIILDDEDYMLWQLRHEIQKMTELKKWEALDELLMQYRKNMPKGQKVHDQFCTFFEARSLILQGENEFVILRKITEALMCTRKGEEKNPLYSQREIELICYRSRYLAKVDDVAAQKNLKNALYYVSLFHSKKQREKLEEPICIELSELCMEQKQWEDALLYLEEAILIVQEGMRISSLAPLFESKIRCLEALYRNSRDWDEKKKECYELCNIVYYIYQTFDQKEKQQKIRNYCEEELICPIIEQVM